MFFEDASVTLMISSSASGNCNPKIRKSVLDMDETDNAGDSACDARSLAAVCDESHVGSDFKKPGGEQVQGT